MTCLPAKVVARLAFSTAASRVLNLLCPATSPGMFFSGMGNRTLLTTWITPLVAFWSGLMTGLPSAVINYNRKQI